MLLEREEHRHDHHDGNDREQHTAHDAHRETEPELVLLAVKQERYKAQHGTQNGEHSGNYLAVVCLDVGLETLSARSDRNGSVFGRQIDAGIHRDTAKHDHGCESALSERHSEYGVRQEQSHKAYGNEQHNHQRHLE